jgi:glucosylceramidase
MGHFARFIRPGARRILCSVSQSNLEAAACVNPDETAAVVVLNRNDQPIKFNLKSLNTATPVALPAHAIATYVFKAKDL